jgi:hypothetical protein
MNEILNLARKITRKRGLTLFVTQAKARQNKTDLIASLILNGPLLLVAADEWLPSFLLPHMLRKQVVEIKEFTGRLRTIRTSTSYRLLDSLTHIPAQGEPILVLDFLQTFYDADVPLSIRFMKLRQCCRQLQRLSACRTVIVLNQELPVADYAKFFPILYAAAHRTVYLDPPSEPQPSTQLAFL